MVTHCNQNSHQIRFWLLNKYKIEVIEFSEQLSQIILAIKVLVTYAINY